MENKAVKVSVIVPVYNAEKYLQECLDSIRNQTLQEIEIICVDDGSTDSSMQILVKNREEDNRVQIISQQNSYAGAARNAGLAISRGDYLVFWDADDIFAETALEEMYTKCEEDQADVCVCGVRKLDEQTKEYLGAPAFFVKKYIPETIPFSIQDIPQYIFNFTTNVPWNKMYRRELIEKYQLQFEGRPRANDLFFVLQALALAEKITVVDEPLVTYRINTGESLTNSLSKSPLCTMDAYMTAYHELERRGVVNEAVKQSFANKLLNAVIFNLNNQTSEESYMIVQDKVLGNEITALLPLDIEEGYYYYPMEFECLKRIRNNTPLEYMLWKNVGYRADKELLKARLKEKTAEAKKASKEAARATAELKKIKESKGYKMLLRFYHIMDILRGRKNTSQ